MITFFHGDDIVASRRALMDRIHSLKKQGVRIEIRTIDGLSIAEVETLLGSSSLFLEETCVVFEGVLGGKENSFRTKIIDLSKNSFVNVFFWENKSISATVLKLFPNGENFSFSAPKKIWSWLDSLLPGNGHASIRLLAEAEKQDGIEMCFNLLIAQVRKIMLMKDGCPPKQTPYAAKKLQTQTNAFTWEKLLAIQAWALKTDIAFKSGMNTLSLREELDLLLLSI